MNKTKVALVYGGKSSEREISIKSGTAVKKALERLNIPFKVFDPADTEKFIKEITAYRPDVVFNMLHGKGGEDGSIQGLFEILGLKYTGSPVKASAVAMDKSFTKEIARCSGIKTPQWITVEKVEDIKKWDRYPAVVKPNTEGSSIGVEIANDKKQLINAVEKAISLDSKVIIEEFIDGREITIGILNGKVLEPIEIVVKEGFYDFQNKYLSDKTEYIISPSLDEKVRRDLENSALKIYRTLGCKGTARADFMLKDDTAYFLEINTIPGMTDHSLLPKAAEASGIGFDELVLKILEGALNEK
ncbi:D-alanine--D-alanine ligase [Persephonella atlantica]|uniref:D-alanine--D-alanine ligase n=1 Tax=Persephonella atlantica TaxID=2699429 RepID=A0ABS1GFG1_9AQUI|nr:D-alanine--D-alanine ligase [Persephonella atlantica]MBK3331512.1 D-alanine--D-alanine ligase [Persephonella atlantica]